MAQRCTRYKRVRSRFGGTVRRCAKFSGRSSNGRRRGYRRRRSGMARRGSHCLRFKRVPSVYGGTVRRCSAFGGRSRKRRGGYRRGHAPFNKGRRCLSKKRVYSRRLGRYVTRCASFGGGRRGAVSAPTGLFRWTPPPAKAPMLLGPGGPPGPRGMPRGFFRPGM